MTEIILRPDQSKLKLSAYAGWSAGRRNQLIVLPTGGGKSIIMTDITKDIYQSGLSECIIAHRQELVGQMSLHVGNRGIPHRIIAPRNIVKQIDAEHRDRFNGRSFVNPTSSISVAGVDTLISRKKELEEWANQQRYFKIDEAHHVLSENKWGTAAAMFPNALGLGVTATPQRADGRGLGRHADGIFDEMHVGPSMRELMDIGALCEYELVVPASDYHIDDTDLDDFSVKKMKEASERSHIVGDVVEEYKKHAYGKRGITFTTDVETAGKIADAFNAAGIPAASVSAQTPELVRFEYIKRFRNGELLQLVNVDLFGEGFDIPAVEVVSLARPTKSLAVYLQQCGRALRSFAGKAYGLIIDHVSNWKRHNYPDLPRAWSLDRAEKRGKREKDPEIIDLRACNNCGKTYPKMQIICPHCWYMPPVAEPTVRTLEQVNGDLILLDRDMLAAMRAAVQLETPSEIASRVSFAAGEWAGKSAAKHQQARLEMQARLSEAIAWYAAYQRARGRDDHDTHRRIYTTLGVDVLTMLAQPRAEMEKYAEKIEQWIARN